MQGMIDRMQRERRTGSIRGEDGRSFAFDERALIDLDYNQLVLGTNVEFEEGSQYEDAAAEASEPVAINVRAATEQVSAAAVQALGPEKDVSLKRDAVGDQVPPQEVKADEVNEPSWQSFPASDPPASGGTT